MVIIIDYSIWKDSRLEPEGVLTLLLHTDVPGNTTANMMHDATTTTTTTKSKKTLDAFFSKSKSESNETTILGNASSKMIVDQ